MKLWLFIPQKIHLRKYTSENTSIFSENEQIPLINNSVDHLIQNLEQSSLIERLKRLKRLKRPNSKWSVDNIYEYVLLTTPLPGMPIESSRSWFFSSISISSSRDLFILKSNPCNPVILLVLIKNVGVCHEVTQNTERKFYYLIW